MKNIGVIGCLPELPVDFPLLIPENSGNMVHAEAPLRMFSRAVHYRDSSFILSGETNFKDFVNKTCSHLIITLANSLSLEKPSPDKYKRLLDSLKQYDVPIIVFGLGIQSSVRDINKAELCKEAIELLDFLSFKAMYLGVRGEFTKKVIEKCTNIKNVFVTGCPSLFSDPIALRVLYEKYTKRDFNVASINVTNLSRVSEKQLFERAVLSNSFFIEPVNKRTHQYYIDLIKEKKDAELPYYFKSMVNNNESSLNKEQLDLYIKTKYRLFRNTKTWYEFNRECVDYTFGTRFHVNMASVLSGVPALWLTHDARTLELTEFFNLPSIDLDAINSMSLSQIKSYISYDKFFKNINKLFNNFNEYLEVNGLPKIKTFQEV
ncbi:MULTISPECIES: polysaccharide pyruvyl transferase family protein [unclassified Escherichia]|uniref:polysaccharide pyruvyl transferase family protein n=2 Tax=Escherichia TaxID=561 RepID=UPI0010292A33|nr:MULTISPECIES: polysaccharide pyruvyl transferase family protein [unclassified Escherichia]RZN19942.1 polysaccharide pyruvyl transferase family protein [Escherichia sp. E14S1]TBR63739.1 polysaccharide pyruvyl transferase family protein [Escherichia sp. E10V4]TLI74407.1 polysaccharide pyruvyl transferase family protein [Escherichia sp. E2586]